MKFSSIFMWLSIVTSLLGMFNNVIALIIFYRLNWFKKEQMLFFINGTVADLCACCSLCAVCTCLLMNYKWSNALNLQFQLNCMGLWVPQAICLTCATRFSLLIAVDRLLCQLCPDKWYRLGKLYHWILISTAWIWSIVQEGGWLFYAKSNQCIVACLSYSSYPESDLWSNFGTVGDTSCTVSAVLIYFGIPLVTALKFKSCTASMITRENKIFYHTQILNRVRLISFIMIPCFIFTTVLGFILADFSNECIFGPHISLMLPPMGIFLTNLASVMVPYVYLVDCGFRLECAKLIVSVASFFKRKAVY